jgi:sporulation protein YlmC with PRC-barrel domain
VAVSESIAFTIGAEASCTDGVCGRVTQVVVDPLNQAVTHLVVEPDHREGLGRLVPIDWVAAAGVDTVALRCTRAEFEKLERAEETRFLPGTEGYPGFDPEQVLVWPYFGANATLPVTVDTLPVGEVAVRRGEQVHAIDGQIGHVEALVVDGPTRHVTHVLLREGHLFARKDVAIPIAAVTSVGEDGIQLSLNKQDVAELPAVALDGGTK